MWGDLDSSAFNFNLESDEAPASPPTLSLIFSQPPRRRWVSLFPNHDHGCIKSQQGSAAPASKEGLPVMPTTAPVGTAFPGESTVTQRMFAPSCSNAAG